MPGLCVSPRILPDQAEVDRLRPTHLRSILYRLDDVKLLLERGLPVVVTLNNECAEVGGDWSGWRTCVQRLARYGRDKIPAIVAGNELDLWFEHGDKRLTPEFAASLVRATWQMLQHTGIQAVATSVAGPYWQDYLAEMIRAADGQCDAVDLHPYGQRPDAWGSPGWGFGDLRVAVSRAAEISKRPVYVTEYGVKVRDAGDERKQAEFLGAADKTLASLGKQVVPSWSWFAWSDDLGTPEEQADGSGFGLRRHDGSRRPAWDAFARLGADTVPTPAPAPTAPHVHAVGDGLRSWMAEDSTTPVACSSFLPLGMTPSEIECAYGANGSEYRWSLVEGRRLARFAAA